MALKRKAKLAGLAHLGCVFGIFGSGARNRRMSCLIEFAELSMHNSESARISSLEMQDEMPCQRMLHAKKELKRLKANA